MLICYAQYQIVDDLEPTSYVSLSASLHRLFFFFLLFSERFVFFCSEIKCMFSALRISLFHTPKVFCFHVGCHRVKATSHSNNSTFAMRKNQQHSHVCTIRSAFLHSKWELHCVVMGKSSFVSSLPSQTCTSGEWEAGRFSFQATSIRDTYVISLIHLISNFTKIHWICIGLNLEFGKHLCICAGCTNGLFFTNVNSIVFYQCKFIFMYMIQWRSLESCKG